MNVERKVHEGGVHNYGKAAFALLDDCCCENILIVTNRSVIAVVQKGLEVGFGCGCIAKGRGADGEDAMQVVPYVGIDDGAEFLENVGRVEVGIGVRPTNPADDSSNIAVEMKETCGGHCFPVVADGGCVFPVVLESLQWAEVDVRVFFEELLELAGTIGSAFEDFEVSTRDETAFEQGQENVAEAFFGIKRWGRCGILTEGLVDLDLDACWEDGASKVVELLGGTVLDVVGCRWWDWRGSEPSDAGIVGKERAEVLRVARGEVGVGSRLKYGDDACWPSWDRWRVGRGRC
jgi:hypothetical protein